MAYYQGSTYDRQSRQAVIAQDHGQRDTPLPILLSQDAVNPGKQTFELPRAHIEPRRAREYSFTADLFAPLIGADAVNPGRQVFDLPPRKPARSTDYTYIETLVLGLIGQDAMAAGAQFVELPPRASARSRDYSFSETIFAPLIGADTLVTGRQLSGNAPLGRPRATSLAETGVNLTVELTATPPGVPAGSVLLPALPLRGVRSADYSYIDPSETWLFGTDSMVTGQQSFALPPAARSRAMSLSDPGGNFTLALDASLSITLPAGQQATDLPPKAQPRARDYTQIDRLPNLIGQDAMAVGDSTYATENPPRGPARSRDYTWLQSLPLHVYQQLPPGASTLGTEGPPRGPLRARDYTFLDLTKQQLVGQDRLYGAPGEVPAYDWQLPTPPQKRMRDYTAYTRVSLGDLAAALHPGEHVLSDRALFVHTLSDQALFVHTLTDILFVHSLSDSVGIQ